MLNLEILFNGIILGSLYGLIGCGFTLIYGVGKIANLAYGHIYMAATYLAYLMIINGIALPVVVLVTAGASLAIGVVTQRIIERAEGSHNRELFISLGIAIILENLLLAYFGGMYRFAPDFMYGTIEIGDIVLETYRVVIFALTLIIFIVLSLIIAKTRVGRSMRAISQNEDASWLMGIDVERVKLATGGIAGGLAAIAALLLLPLYPIYPAMGWTYLLVGFAIVILGGMGSVKGTLLAGVVLGAGESLFAYYISTGLRGTIYFITIIIVILIRPEGFFGSKEATSL
ncbi:MAG: branched-chain amino acid ABC transporter permease [Candidatus Thorarchaeota archaeon]